MDLTPNARLVPVVLLLAACASSLQWTQPGASQAQIDADLRACREAAERVPVLGRERSVTPSGALSYPTGTDLDADRQMALAQRQEACMRARGYQLVRGSPR